MGMARIVWDEYQKLESQVEDLSTKLEREWARTDAVIAQARDWKARTRILAKQRDEWRSDACAAGAELDKLRRSRAQDRANPDHPGDLIEELRNENKRLQGLVKAGDEFIKLVRERVGLSGDLDGTESALDALDDLRRALDEYKEQVAQREAITTVEKLNRSDALAEETA